MKKQQTILLGLAFLLCCSVTALAQSGADWGYGNRNGRVNDRINDRDDYRYGRSQRGYDPYQSDTQRGGRFGIQIVATNRMLDVDGGQVVQREANGSRGQQWDLEDAGNGYYYIRSAETGEVVTIQGRGESGDSLVLARQRRNDYTQLWEVRQGPDNGYYFIARNGRSIDSPSSARYDGGRMQVYNRNGEANQRFRLIQANDNDNRWNDGRNRDRWNDRDRGNDRWNDRNRDRWNDRNDDQYGAGRMTWRGRVDGEIEIEIRGGSARLRHISGQAPYGERANFSSALPRREANVYVQRSQGRGRVDVIEQPSARNGYTAVIRISDSDRGADDYEIVVSWN